jgi:hypothetical protein
VGSRSISVFHSWVQFVASRSYIAAIFGWLRLDAPVEAVRTDTCSLGRGAESSSMLF